MKRNIHLHLCFEKDFLSRIITTRGIGGGHKRLYRRIDFKRNKLGLIAKVSSIEYDPNRNARICLLKYEDGDKRYILHPRDLSVGNLVISDLEVPVSIGNALPLSKIPSGTDIHNVEIQLSRGGQISRSAGTYSEISAKQGRFVTVRLPSGKLRLVNKFCWATVGRVGNVSSYNITLGKAGRKRWLGKTPKVRGVAMNPCDHPHGGGEGRSPIGRAKPVTPWGKPALGKKTRKHKHYSNVYTFNESYF